MMSWRVFLVVAVAAAAEGEEYTRTPGTLTAYENTFNEEFLELLGSEMKYLQVAGRKSWMPLQVTLPPLLQTPAGGRPLLCPSQHLPRSCCKQYGGGEPPYVPAPRKISNASVAFGWCSCRFAIAFRRRPPPRTGLV